MNILHLYHDIMNLYGEYGNISALTRMLEKNRIEYRLDRLSLKDEVRVMDYDFIYVGSGTERNQKCILPHLISLKPKIEQYIASGRTLLMTGNSFELMGKEITDAEGRVWEGMNLYPFTVKEQNRRRTTADAVFTLNRENRGSADREGQVTQSLAENADRPIVGFINKCSTINGIGGENGINRPLFTVKMGLGNNAQEQTEGICDRSFLGTHLTGPLLIKNPYFLISVAKVLCRTDRLETGHLKYEIAAYEVTLRELSKRLV